MYSYRLKSDMFEADNSVGEDSLTKDINFRGHDVDAQFSCCLATTTSSVPELGIFGKVFVTSLDHDGNEQETQFSFNLIKNVIKKTLQYRNKKQNIQLFILIELEP